MCCIFITKFFAKGCLTLYNACPVRTRGKAKYILTAYNILTKIQKNDCLNIVTFLNYI